MLTLSPGSQLGQYRVLGPIQVGRRSELYRARRSSLFWLDFVTRLLPGLTGWLDVAIKLFPATTVTREWLGRFHHEVKAARILRYKSIVRVLDVGIHDGCPYIVSELVEGRVLRDRLREGPLPPDTAFTLALQIANGLGVAHRRGVVHRDLKPASILLTKSGDAKIVDFGLKKLAWPAPFLDSTDDLTGQLGTVAYMAPEQIRESGSDLRSDIFSFGTVFYEMLTGRAPFHGATSTETMEAVVGNEPDPAWLVNPLLPRTIDRFLTLCLAKDPGQRFQSTEPLVRELESISREFISQVKRPQSAPPRLGPVTAQATPASISRGEDADHAPSRVAPEAQTATQPPFEPLELAQQGSRRLFAALEGKGARGDLVEFGAEFALVFDYAVPTPEAIATLDGAALREASRRHLEISVAVMPNGFTLRDSVSRRTARFSEGGLDRRIVFSLRAETQSIENPGFYVALDIDGCPLYQFFLGVRLVASLENAESKMLKTPIDFDLEAVVLEIRRARQAMQAPEFRGPPPESRV